MQNKWFMFFSVIAVFFFFGCVTFSGDISEIPPESLEPTPFEGIWRGVSKANGIEYELEFKGNTYTMYVSTWQKGLFLYVENKIVYYPITVFVGTRWANPNEDMRPGKTRKSTLKYSFGNDTLIIDGVHYRKQDDPLKMPDDYAFFAHENSFIVSHLDEVKNGEVFTIEEIDDIKPSYYSSSIRTEPGVHKIKFRQNLTKIEAGYYKTDNISGYFTANFAPGGRYRFFLYTDGHSAFMPDYLPKIPTGTARVVIARTDFADGIERYYQYVDIPLY
jgi:hypothetical protein